jgi:hypothetical protein
MLPAVAGCAVRNPWTYNTPPTALESGATGQPLRSRDVVVVGEIANPLRTSVAWSDIGPGVTQALGQALLNEGEFEVWSNTGLARAVEQVLAGPTTERAARLGRLHEAHPEVRLVITGQVTDFHHTSEVARDVRRRAFIGTRKEAIVAIQFNVVDLQVRRELLGDHVHGTSSIGSRRAEHVYADIAFGSYLFWNSPLGRATEEAIDKTVTRIVQAADSAEGPVRIVRTLTSRRVQLSSLPRDLSGPDEALFVCRIQYGDGRAAMRPVLDAHTGQPLRARIVSWDDQEPTAWLLGQKPADVDLRGAELRRNLPAAPGSSPAEDGAESTGLLAAEGAIQPDSE